MKAKINSAFFYKDRAFRKGEIVELPLPEVLAKKGLIEIIETEAIEKPEKKVKKKTSKKKKIEE